MDLSCPDGGDVEDRALDTPRVGAQAQDLLRALLSLARGQVLSLADADILHAAETASPEMAPLIAACRKAGQLGGGGDELARELARGLAPVALADLAARAQATRGRDADRLWRPVLAAAGLQVETPGAGGVSLQAQQIAVIVADLDPAQLQALAGLLPGGGAGGPVTETKESVSSKDARCTISRCRESGLTAKGSKA